MNGRCSARVSATSSDLRLNVGLIGAGRMGRIHAEHLAHRIPRARLVAVADVVQDAARQAAVEHAIPTAVSDYRVLLDDPDLDAVVVASATNTHARIIEEAAAARKHVFCEKPIDLSLKRIDEALAAASQAGIKLQLGFNRRFDANFQRVKHAVQNGDIGQPWRIHITSRDPAPPPMEYIKVSGGLFLDMAIHDFDMARYLIGAEIEEVFAVTGVLVDEAIGKAGDVDTAVTMLQFANCVIGSIDNCRAAAYGYDQRVEVLGSGGMITTQNEYPNSAIVSDRRNIHRDLPFHFFMDRYLDSYRVEMELFVASILDDTPPPATGEDGRISVVLGLAAKRSGEERRPVRVSEISA